MGIRLGAVESFGLSERRVVHAAVTISDEPVVDVLTIVDDVDQESSVVPPLISLLVETERDLLTFESIGHERTRPLTVPTEAISACLVVRDACELLG